MFWWRVRYDVLELCGGSPILRQYFRYSGEEAIVSISLYQFKCIYIALYADRENSKIERVRDSLNGEIKDEVDLIEGFK